MLNRVLFLPSFQEVQSQTVKSTVAVEIKGKRPVIQHTWSWKVSWGDWDSDRQKNVKGLFKYKAFYI